MPAPTDTFIAGRVAAFYNGPTGFDHVLQVNPMAPYLGIAYLDNCDLVVCRGSRTADDWLRDAESEAARSVHEYPQLGLIPYGFGAYAPETYEATKPLLRGLPLIAAGHSLGGPEAIYQAAIHLLHEGQVIWRAFEPPRGGTPTLTALFAKTDCRSYDNGIDPFPWVPVPVSGLSWEHQSPMTHIHVEPKGLTMLVPTAWHDITLVAEGVKDWEAAQHSPLA